MPARVHAMVNATWATHQILRYSGFHGHFFYDSSFHLTCKALLTACTGAGMDSTS